VTVDPLITEVQHCLMRDSDGVDVAEAGAMHYDQMLMEDTSEEHSEEDESGEDETLAALQRIEAYYCEHCKQKVVLQILNPRTCNVCSRQTVLFGRTLASATSRCYSLATSDATGQQLISIWKEQCVYSIVSRFREERIHMAFLRGYSDEALTTLFLRKREDLHPLLQKLLEDWRVPAELSINEKRDLFRLYVGRIQYNQSLRRIRYYQRFTKSRGQLIVMERNLAMIRILSEYEKGLSQMACYLDGNSSRFLVWREYTLSLDNQYKQTYEIPLSHFVSQEKDGPSEMVKEHNFSQSPLDGLQKQHGYYRVVSTFISIQVTNVNVSPILLKSSVVSRSLPQCASHPFFLVAPGTQSLPESSYAVSILAHKDHAWTSDESANTIPLRDWRWYVPPRSMVMAFKIVSRGPKKGDQVFVRLTSEIEVSGLPLLPVANVPSVQTSAVRWVERGKNTPEGGEV